MSSELTIEGSRQFFVWQADVDVFLDRDRIGQVSLIDTKSFNISPGQHTLYIRARFFARKSNILEFRVSDGESITVRYSVNRLTGGQKLEKLT